ncbi:rifin [Plasmodium reichenowi]|uniref:Rifin n=1 Tax=Plasmodium reichenowi TaxID=5854 RepID=A0A060RQ45_PLARE|nr:rifin [Plasmodium reichenowi]
MKLQCSKILLLFLPLNILVYNNNEPQTTPHHTQTNRSLCECDIQSSNYDNDPQMKKVMNNFNRQTSQRFEEYKERLKDKRQKRKEERDKNVQEIIDKDKMEKSLADKVEKGCLKCGCGLGGVAASVGLFGGLGIYGSKTAAIAKAVAAAQEAVKDGAMAATIKAAGAEAFKSAIIEGIEKEFGVSILGVQRFESLFKSNTYTNVENIARAINTQYNPSSCLTGGHDAHPSICTWVTENFRAAQKIPGKVASTYESIKVGVENVVSEAQNAAGVAAQQATKDAIKASTDAVEFTYAGCQTAIIASVVAILIIALVMIIIYLVLRYRRKKKMNKKAQYTKLLNQ